MKLKNWINCYIFKFHNWTSPIQEGKWNITGNYKEDVIEGAKMYCKYCKKESEVSIQFRKQLLNNQ